MWSLDSFWSLCRIGRVWLDLGLGVSCFWSLVEVGFVILVGIFFFLFRLVSFIRFGFVSRGF